MDNFRDSSQVRWALSYLRPYGRRVAVLALLSAAEITLRVLSPWPLKAIVDSVFGAAAAPSWLSAAIARVPGGRVSDRAHVLAAIVMVGVLIQLVHQIVLMLHGRLQVSTGGRMVLHVREQLFCHIQALALAHHAKTPTGDAVHRLEADARCLEQIVFRGMFPFVFSVGTLIVMFFVLVRIDLPLALVSLSIVPPLYVWLKYYTRRMAPEADRARQLDSRLAERLYENFSAIRLVKSHAREDFEVARFSGVARDTMNAWIRVGKQSTVFSIVVGTLTIVGSSLVLLFGGLAVLRGTLTPGTLLLVLAYLGFIYGPLSAIAQTANELQQAFAGARRVRGAFALTPEPIAVSGARQAVRLRGEVAFDRVTFAYEPSRPVLREVSFTATPGETIALVGPSGGGKSTLVTLMARFYERSGGAIRIDGVDVREYELKSLRQSIALVLQDAIIMSGSVLDNLRYGRLEASDDEVRRAAQAANADEFIATMPNGYRSNLGEAGVGLSGGQKQRLSIARAFLKDAPILVLDEPTAALDTLSERLVIDAVKRLRAGRTTFVIAHRLSTVLEADRILVLDKGQIVAQGRHDDLVRSCGLYRDMASQLVGFLPKSEVQSSMLN